MAKRGRPKFQFTDDHVRAIRGMARCHCPDHEIALVIGCDEATLKRNFAPVLKEERANGVKNIRAAQYRLAMGDEKRKIPPDKTMLIFLGKVLCKQVEARDHEDLEKNKKKSANIKIVWQEIPNAKKVQEYFDK